MEKYSLIVISGQSAIIAEPAENIVTGDAALNATMEADALLALAKQAIASAAATGMMTMIQMEGISAVRVFMDGGGNAVIGDRKLALQIGAEVVTTHAPGDKYGTKAYRGVLIQCLHAKENVVMFPLIHGSIMVAVAGIAELNKDIVMDLNNIQISINVLTQVLVLLDNHKLAALAAQADAELQDKIAEATVSGTDGIAQVEILLMGRHAAYAEEEQKTAAITAMEIIQTAEARGGIM